MDEAQAKARAIAECVAGPLRDAIRDVERCSNELPEEQDFHFYSNFKQFKTPIAGIESRARQILQTIGTTRTLRTEVTEWPKDPEDSYEWLVGVQDDVLEGVGSALDELGLGAGKKSQEIAFSRPNAGRGKGRNHGNGNGDSNGSPDGNGNGAKVASKKKQRPPVPFHVKSIPRPQDKFDYPADNSKAPFRHLSREELLGLPATLPSNPMELHARTLGVTTGHPLKMELDAMAFMDDFPCGGHEPQQPKALSETPFTIVDLPSALESMAQKLRGVREFAVDLENHHYRSYQGFVCLMQISTRDEDFIVDTLVLREHIGPVLRDVFANPSIRKVIHGSDSDVVWLQRDFGIYICNMFDTGQAARVLNLEGCGLAFLLDKFCNVQADKRYQLADWRLRPLTAEMLKYAREDTHYLLYVYDVLQQLLRTHHLLSDSYLEVCRRSRDLCLKLYEKDQFTDTSFLHLHGLSEKNFSPSQLSIVAALFAWRDNLSRKEDESTGYVMPNHLIFRIAEEAPEEPKKLHSILKGSHPIAGLHSRALLTVIREAKASPSDEVISLHATLTRKAEDVALEGDPPSIQPEVAIEVSSSRPKDEPSTSKQAVAPTPLVQLPGKPIELPMDLPVEKEDESKPRFKIQTPIVSTLPRPAPRGGLGAALFGKPRKTPQVDYEAIASIQASLVLPFAVKPAAATAESSKKQTGDEQIQDQTSPTTADDDSAATAMDATPAEATTQVESEVEECIWFDGGSAKRRKSDDGNIRVTMKEAVEDDQEIVLPPSLSEKYGKSTSINKSRKRPRPKNTKKLENSAAAADGSSHVNAKDLKPKKFDPSHWNLDQSKVAGFKPKRRAVFPASGNKTATFN